MLLPWSQLQYPVCFSRSRNEEDYGPGWFWYKGEAIWCMRGNLFLDKARCFKGMSFPLQSFDLYWGHEQLGWADKTQVPSGFDNWVPVQNPMGNHHCSHFNGQTQTTTSHQITGDNPWSHPPDHITVLKDPAKGQENHVSNSVADLSLSNFLGEKKYHGMSSIEAAILGYTMVYRVY